MNLKIDRWLNSDGWKGIIARVTCAVVIFVILLKNTFLINWIRVLTHEQPLLIDYQKEFIVQRAALTLLLIELIFELVVAMKLLFSRKRD
ncbi:hypothetical protein [Burkholderia sp. 3C]